MSTIRNISIYPWFRFCQNLLFWQAVWFLYFQDTLSAAEAIALYAIYDIATTVMEVPSGIASDRFGRRRTLILAGVATCSGAMLLGLGDGFMLFALGQVLLGAGSAFASGTDTSLLYESLAAEGRTTETEDQELRAWRFAFTGLALSAITGGAMALASPVLPFLAAAAGAAVMLTLTLRMVEPPRATAAQGFDLSHLKPALRDPVLGWLFVLAVLMYAYSHIPFVFGQPLILDVLAGFGLAGEAPFVSGAVASVMMLISVAASLIAQRLRRRIGLVAILMLAFGMQVLLVAILAFDATLIAVAMLLLRMVPDSLSRPFLLARIQPLLPDDVRATYLSIQSLAGRLLLAGTLLLATRAVPDNDALRGDDLTLVLGAYTAVGFAALAILAIAARRIPLER